VNLKRYPLPFKIFLFNKPALSTPPFRGLYATSIIEIGSRLFRTNLENAANLMKRYMGTSIRENRREILGFLLANLSRLNWPLPTINEIKDPTLLARKHGCHFFTNGKINSYIIHGPV